MHGMAQVGTRHLIRVRAGQATGVDLVCVLLAAASRKRPLMGEDARCCRDDLAGKVERLEGTDLASLLRSGRGVRVKGFSGGWAVIEEE